MPCASEREYRFYAYILYTVSELRACRLQFGQDRLSSIAVLFFYLNVVLRLPARASTYRLPNNSCGAAIQSRQCALSYLNRKARLIELYGLETNL